MFSSTHGGFLYFRLSRSLLSMARFSADPTALRMLLPSVMDSAPLCSCSGAQKTRPMLPSGRSGYLKQSHQFTSGFLPRLLDLAPFPSARRSRLLRRHSRSATCTIRHRSPTRQLRHSAGLSQPGRQPSGVGRLKVSACCVDRATTICTGSLWLVFISTCTTFGGTQTKSPAWASWR